MDINNIKFFLLKQGIEFKNLNLYKRAFTHTSYVHETSDKEVESYERLEFLGDAVLGKEIAEYLFLKYKNLDPGELSLLRSNIVNKASLSRIGKDLDLGKLIFFGRGEAGKVPSDSVFEDVVEALIGAIYLDLGDDFTKEFIINLVNPYLDKIDFQGLKDYKTQLQEELQSEKRKTVTYKTFKETKIKNRNEFHVNAMLDDIVLGFGKAESKKKAEQLAAKDALSKKPNNEYKGL